MKTLTTQANVARQRRHATVVKLLTLTLWRDRFGASPTSTTLYLSDAVRVELGQTWLPLVKDWGALGDDLSLMDPAGTPGSFDVTLADTVVIGGKPRFTDLVRQGINITGTYEATFGDATVEWLFSGGTSGDQIVLGKFLVDDIVSVTEETISLRMSGRERIFETLEETGLVTFSSGVLAFYQFDIRQDNPTLHNPSGITATSTTVGEFDIAAQQTKSSTGVITLDRWWILHRDPVVHPGLTLVLKLRQNGGAAIEAYEVVVRVATLDSTSLSAIQAYTYNNPPVVGNVLASQAFPAATAPEPGNYTINVPIGALNDVLVRIENQGTPGSGNSPARAFSQAFTVDYL